VSLPAAAAATMTKMTMMMMTLVAHLCCLFVDSPTGRPAEPTIKLHITYRNQRLIPIVSQKALCSK